jgi:serine/threonine protein kinase
MLKEIKISPNTKPANYLKELSPAYANLLERILVFNPKKRLTIDEILSHEVVKSFRKKEEELSCLKEICTSIDDNKKFSVDEYRKLVYGISYVEQPKPKALSSSLGANSASPKYLTSNNNNKTTISFGNSKV